MDGFGLVWVLVMGMASYKTGAMNVQIPMTEEACVNFLETMHDRTGYQFEYCVNQNSGKVLVYDEKTQKVQVVQRSNP
jgi:hypothetical protein